MQQHKGQSFVLEGNMVGEQIANSKLSYDAMGNLEYIGVCKVGVIDSDTRHFISKLIFDAMGNLTRELFAINQRYTGATNVTVDLTNPEAEIILIAGDVNEIQKGDKIYINTLLNPETWLTVQRKTSSNSVVINMIESAGLTAEVGAAVTPTDVRVELTDKNKPFERRRWDLRALYIYR